MEGVQWSAEAGEASSEDEADMREVREVVKPVFFNMPLLRFVKILVGATLCTVVLNPPYALLGANDVMVGTADIKEAELLPESRVSSSIVTEVMEEAELGLEALAEKASSIIAPSAAPQLVRTAKKKKNQQDATKPKGQTEAVLEADAKIVQNSMRREGDVVNADGEVVEDKLVQTVQKEATEKTPQWTWRSANMLPHFIIAAMLLIGFGIQVRSRMTGLLQSIPTAIAVVRKIRA